MCQCLHTVFILLMSAPIALTSATALFCAFPSKVATVSHVIAYEIQIIL